MMAPKKKAFHRFVAALGALVLLASLLAMQQVAVDNYRTPLGNMLVPNGDPDAKVGSPAPRWLAKMVPADSCVVVISCASCSANSVLPNLVSLATKRRLVVLAKSADPEELASLRKRFSSLRFVSIPERVEGMNLSITPKLYVLDARGRFAHVQDTLLNNDDFIAQF